MGCCQASCQLSSAITMTTTVVMAAVTASPGRPISVTDRGAKADERGTPSSWPNLTVMKSCLSR